MSTESSTPGYPPVYAEEPDTGSSPAGPGYSTASSSSTTGSSTTDTAKDQAATVAGSVGSAGQHVAGVARDEIGQVAAEAKDQARNVLGQAHAELTQQASEQQQRVAVGLRSLGTELGSMADGSQDSGLATDLARQASGKAHEVADWLENRDPSSLLGEVKTFARRRPGTFLALALVAGVAAGRLTRGLKDESSTTTDTEGAPSAAPDETVGTGAYASTEHLETPVYTGTSAYADDLADDLAYAEPPSIIGDRPINTGGAYPERTTYTDGERR